MKPGRSVALALGAGLVLHAVVAALTELVPDEAYYRLWSEAPLSVRYFDHPPAIAWAIKAARVFGDGSLAVRLPALLAGVLTPLFLSLAARCLGGDRAMVRAAWIASGTISLHALGIVVTPDSTLMIGWSGALWAACAVLARAQRPGLPTYGPLGWLGLALGLAILSKLTGWILLAGAVGGLWWAGSKRSRLWIPIAVALAVAGVWIVETVTHLGESDVAFQLGHLDPSGVPGQHLPVFVLGQFGLLTPLIGWALVGWGVQAVRRRSPADRLLLALSAPLIVTFTLVALFQRPEANWPGPGWLAAMVGLALQPPRPGFDRWMRWTAAPLVFVTHLFALTGIPGLPAARDPTDRMRGWQQMAEALEPICAEHARDDLTLVVSGYGLASEVRLRAPSCMPLRVPPGGRKSQFDLWPVPPWPAGGEALLLQRCGGSTLLGPDCEVVGEPVPLPPVHRRLCVRTFRCGPAGI